MKKSKRIESDADLREVEVRAASATPGPWGVGGPPLSVVASDGTVSWVGAGHRDPSASLCDAEFVAHAREDVPALCDALRNAWEALRIALANPTLVVAQDSATITQAIAALARCAAEHGCGVKSAENRGEGQNS